MKSSSVFACCVLLTGLWAADASAVLLTFEGLPDSTSIDTQFSSQGVIFGNAISLTVGFSLNEIDFPPHSGDVAIGDDGVGPLEIVFSAPASEVSAWFTFDSRLTVTAFDAVGTQLGSLTTTSSSNLGSSLLVDMNFAGTRRLEISAATPETFIMDDLSFSVPEPETFALLLTGLIGVAGRRLGAPRLR